MRIIFAVMVAACASGLGGCKVEATRDIFKAETDQLKVIGQRFDIGAVLISDVLTQESELANTETTLPALRKQLEQRGHLLLTLTGRFPNQERADRITRATLNCRRTCRSRLRSRCAIRSSRSASWSTTGSWLVATATSAWSR